MYSITFVSSVITFYIFSPSLLIVFVSWHYFAHSPVHVHTYTGMTGRARCVQWSW